MYVIIMRKEIQENEFLLMGMVNLLQFYYLAFKVYKNFPPPTCFFVFFCKLFSFTILQVVLTVNHICIHLFWIGFLSCLVHFLYFLFYTSKKKRTRQLSCNVFKQPSESCDGEWFENKSKVQDMCGCRYLNKLFFSRVCDIHS